MGVKKTGKVEELVDGKTYSATYEVKNGMITVYSHEFDMEETTQLSDLPVKILASLLLSEMINKARYSLP